MADGTIGTTVRDSNISTEEVCVLSPWTVPANCVINTIEIYLTNAYSNSNYYYGDVAIYNNASGAKVRLRVSQNIGLLPDTSAWYTGTFSALTLNSGDVIYIAVAFEAPPEPTILSAGTDSISGALSYYSAGFPNCPSSITIESTISDYKLTAYSPYSLLPDNSNIEWVSATGKLRQTLTSGEYGLVFDDTSKRVEYYTYNSKPASHTLIYWDPSTKKLRTTDPS